LFEIVVLSGKGGTGKTSLTAAFAHLAENHVICDLDVDAPDLHLLLHPRETRATDFVSGHEARILAAPCTACGVCAEMCRFDAIDADAPTPVVDPLKCEGCKVCVTFCPENAIAFQEKQCGEWYRSETRFGPMVHAQLFPGEENSGRLVALLRREAKELAEQLGNEMILSDGPPGIGCPAISSLAGVAFAVIVTEPTPSGRHDLERVLELCRHFSVPVGVIINKSDLNPREAASIRAVCDRQKLVLLGERPLDSAITLAMMEGKAITEYDGAEDFSNRIRMIWSHIMAEVRERTTA
jgi:MinD superfamily P-loop ATPase